VTWAVHTSAFLITGKGACLERTAIEHIGKTKGKEKKRDEGIAYGNKLLAAGVPAELKIYKGAPHPIMAMDGTYRLQVANRDFHPRVLNVLCIRILCSG